MSAPGVGIVVALGYMTAVEDPARFKKSTAVAAYFGMTPRRYQSGEMDRAGRISKCGDAMIRGLLFEAGKVLLSRSARPCPLKSWGETLAKRVGKKKATMAVARKLADRINVLSFRTTPTDGAGGGPLWTWIPYSPPGEGTRIVILSDAGAGLPSLRHRADVSWQWGALSEIWVTGADESTIASPRPTRKRSRGSAPTTSSVADAGGARLVERIGCDV